MLMSVSVLTDKVCKDICKTTAATVYRVMNRVYKIMCDVCSFMMYRCWGPKPLDCSLQPAGTAASPGAYGVEKVSLSINHL